MNAITSILNRAEALGYTVSVNDGGAWPIKYIAPVKANRKKIMEAIDSVDEACIRFHDDKRNNKGAATVVNGLEPDELIADFTNTEWIDEWFNDFFEQSEDSKA